MWAEGRCNLVISIRKNHSKTRSCAYQEHHWCSVNSFYCFVDPHKEGSTVVFLMDASETFEGNQKHHMHCCFIPWKNYSLMGNFFLLRSQSLFSLKAKLSQVGVQYLPLPVRTVIVAIPTVEHGPPSWLRW